MSPDKQGTVRNASEGGVVGDIPVADQFQFHVAPTTANDFNTARLRLIPIACLRVDDIRFEFDSSFIAFDPSPDAKEPNDIRSEMEQLAALVRANPGAPLSVFGHADPVGNDNYNKALSGRRAQAIYGMLIRDTTLWEDLFSGPKPIAGDNWGKDALQTMEKATGLPPGTSHSVLFKAYMDKLCGPDFKLQKSDFLARGADKKGKGDFQGCGEFNPVLIFSKKKQAPFDEAERKRDKAILEKRNKENAPNRRVMILMFRKGSQILPTKWPCPTVKDGIAGCQKRFFSDGEKRRTFRLPEDDRQFTDAQDTFACRFYQRISSGAPCEGILRLVRIRLFDNDRKVLVKAPFLAKLSSASTGAARTIQGFSNRNGDAVLFDVSIPATCNLRWSRPSDDSSGKADNSSGKANDAPPKDFEFELDVFLDLTGKGVDADEDPNSKTMTSEEARRRLSNLGYATGKSLGDDIRLFQRDLGLPTEKQTGQLDESTVQSLRQHHDATREPPPLPPPEKSAQKKGTTKQGQKTPDAQS